MHQQRRIHLHPYHISTDFESHVMALETLSIVRDSPDTPTHRPRLCAGLEETVFAATLDNWNQISLKTLKSDTCVIEVVLKIGPHAKAG
jgi:hypothetical protein